MHTDGSQDQTRLSTPRTRIARALSLATCATVMGAMIPAGAAQAQTQAQASTGAATTAAAQSFDIPAGPLAHALRRLASQANLPLAFTHEQTAGKLTAGVHGHLTPAQALARVLEGSGLEAVLLANQSYVLKASSTPPAAPPSSAANAPVEGAKLPISKVVAGTSDGSVGFLADESSSVTRTNTPLMEVPRSVYVITPDQLEELQPLSVAQALLYSPGIYANAEGNYDGADSPNSNEGMLQRGFTSAQYIDGLQSFSYAALETSFLDRIDVVNGPSSTLYGQMNPGGLVNMALKKATDKPLYSASIGLGSWNRVQTTVDVSDKLNEAGDLRYRVSAIAVNSGTEVDYINYRKWGVQPSVTWTISPDTSLTVLAQYVDTPQTGQVPFTRPALGTLYSYPGHGKLNRSTFLGDLNSRHNAAKQAMLEEVFKTKVTQNIAFESTARWEFSQNNGDVLLLSAGSTKSGQENTSVTTGVYGRTGSTRQRHTNTVAMDNHFTGEWETGPISHTWLAGLDVRQYKQTNNTITGVTASDIDIWDPVISGGYTPCDIYEPGACNATLRMQHYMRTQYGLYLQDQARWNGFTATVGARNDRTRYSSSVIRYKATGELQTDSSTATAQEDHSTTYEAGLNYQFQSGVAPFVSYSTSFEPNEGSTDWEGNYLPPTTGEQVELGVKYLIPNSHIMLSASVFHLNENHTLVEDTVHSTADETYNTDGGRTTSKGFELSANANISTDTRVMASFSYDKAYYAEDNETVTQVNPKTGETGATVSEKGKSLAKIPRRMFSVFGSQKLHMVPGLSVNAGVRYVGATWADAANSYQVPSYTLVDAGMDENLGQITDSLKGMDARLTISNLTNRYYVTSCSTTMCYLGQGRNVLLTLTKKW